MQLIGNFCAEYELELHFLSNTLRKLRAKFFEKRLIGHDLIIFRAF